MSESFDYIDAPQFFDFNRDVNDLDDNSYEEYFNNDHEENDPLNSDFSEVTLRADDLQDIGNPNKNRFRRSISVGDLEKILETGIQLRSGKEYSSVTINKSDNFVPKQSLNNEAGGPSCKKTRSNELLNRLVQPKRQFKSDQNLTRNEEYIPIAEAVRKFQINTPKRFRTKPTLNKEPLKCTVAQSPKLKTTGRSRQTNVLSFEQKEKLLLDEAKKSQFKANPLNKKILLPPPSAISVKERKSTVPKPFKLTPSMKTISESPMKEITQFHARPVPKSVYQPDIKAPLRTQLTNPQTPTFMKRSVAMPLPTPPNKTVGNQQPPTKLKPTIVKPFSFELRDQVLKSKRESLIQRCREVEKKSREFHAKPVPKGILEPLKKLQSFGSKENMHICADSKNIVSQFKAKPPTVLYKKPFEPKRPTRPLTEIKDFTLNTDVRAKEREDFEYYIKEKEERLAAFRQEEEMLNKQKEEEEILRARKEAEFKAQNIKKYKEVKIFPANKVTCPVSPKFATKKSKDTSENKENS